MQTSKHHEAADSATRNNARRRTAARRPGSAIVEYAVLLPVLLMIFLVCLDFGRLAYSDIALTNAVRVGADYGSSNPPPSTVQTGWIASVRRAVADELDQNPWFKNEKLSIVAPVVTVDDNGRRRVRVEATYPFEPVIQIGGHSLLPGYGGPIVLRRIAVVPTKY